MKKRRVYIKKKGRLFMKRFLGVIIAASMAISLSACGSSSSAPASSGSKAAASAASSGGKISIKMATGGQDTLPSYAAAIDVINDIKSQDKNIDIQYFGARQLGDDDAILQQVMSGTLQMGGTAASAFAQYTNLMDGFTIPFLINNYDKERTAMQSDEAQAIFDQIEKDLGIKILASYDSGMRHLANNTRPIQTVADMKGLKMRVVPTDCLIDTFKALGANPTTMNYGDIYTGLQNKVIDGEEVNITSIYSEKHYEVLKYFTEIGLYPFETTIFCNAKWFNSLDADTQKTLEDGFKNGYNYVFDKYLKSAEDQGNKAMEDAGIQVTKVDDPSEFKAAVADVSEKYKNEDPLITAFVNMAENLK
jgi:tripartite ATP-independent transporter DctP family solute receptor